MSKSESSLRKAAILIASLDAATAEALLAQMPPAQAEAVQNEMLQLGAIDPAEQETIIEEFFRLGPLIPETDPPGLELDDSLSHRFAKPTGAPASRALHAEGNGPFHFLQQTEAEALVPFVEREHPQTVALLLSHLSPDRAGHVLARLTPALQADVIRRMVDLEETDPQVVREVERAVEQWLQTQQTQRLPAAGVAAVSAILNSADGVARRQILSNLAVHDRGLAHKFSHQLAGQRRITFAEMCNFETDSLTRVIRAADGETIVLALVGAARSSGSNSRPASDRGVALAIEGTGSNGTDAIGRHRSCSRIACRSGESYAVRRPIAGHRPLAIDRRGVRKHSMAAIIKAKTSKSQAQPAVYRFESFSSPGGGDESLSSNAAATIEAAQQQAAEIRQHAAEEGRLGAEQIIEQRINERMDAVLPIVRAATAELADAKQAWMRRWEQSAVQLSVKIAERIVRREVARSPQIALDLARSAGTDRRNAANENPNEPGRFRRIGRAGETPGSGNFTGHKCGSRAR